MKNLSISSYLFALYIILHVILSITVLFELAEGVADLDLLHFEPERVRELVEDVLVGLVAGVAVAPDDAGGEDAFGDGLVVVELLELLLLAAEDVELLEEGDVLLLEVGRAVEVELVLQGLLDGLVALADDALLHELVAARVVDLVDVVGGLLHAGQRRMRLAEEHVLDLLHVDLQVRLLERRPLLVRLREPLRLGIELI